MRCKICQKEFIPSKYQPKQQICSQPECQKLRQIRNLRAWRLKNPDYFKSRGQDGAWQGIRQRYNRLWRKSHKNYLKDYENAHKKQRREYMREYMRKYRKAKLS